MGRAPCCDKANVKKGPWSPEEDAKLKAYIEENGTGGNWIALPQKIGLKRCGKSCRLRWLNYLRPNIKHGGFSEEEDDIICSLYINIGSRWSIIAAQLPGRTDNDIKNYWNTSLKKKLLSKQQKEEQARRASWFSVKQEMKRETETEEYMVPPYWPQQQPPLMPLTSTSTAIPHSMYSPHPYGFSYVQAHPFSVLSPASSISPINNTYSQVGAPNDTFQGLAGFPGELIYSNNQQIFDGLEGFYGTDNMVVGCSSSAESSSWGDIYSLGFPQIVSGFEACQQSTPQVSTYDEQHCTWAA
ncbi:hypothetical protein V6N13_123879 [Hibiscus sabdariffa]|uniref:Transcription factor RAX3 n=1 Tax=Hibiscus sabdariffa TaxID=183260 RepID=A0ABR2QUW2_9ROSI